LILSLSFSIRGVTTDYLIILNSAGKSLKISSRLHYDSNTIIEDVYKHAAKEFNVPDTEIHYFGIYICAANSEGKNMESDVLLGENHQKLSLLALMGELVCEFKMKPWFLNVRLEGQSETTMEFSPQ
jgi:hypothetical protein